MEIQKFHIKSERNTKSKSGRQVRSEIKNWVPLSASLLPNWSSSTCLTGIPARETQVFSYQLNKNKLTHIWQPLNLAGACCCFFFFTTATTTTTCVVRWTPDPPVWPFRRREEAIKRLEEGEPLEGGGGERKEVDWGSVQLTVSVRSREEAVEEGGRGLSERRGCWWWWWWRRCHRLRAACLLPPLNPFNK